MKKFSEKVAFVAITMTMVIGIVVLVVTTVLDFRARSGMFTTTGQVREYWGTK